MQDNAKKRFRTSLNDLYSKSHRLAKSVHNGILQTAQKGANIHDRKVKQAVTQLLLGTNTPGILVELGFVTNPDEAQRLASHTYQQQLVRGIVNGVSSYLRS